MPACRQAFGDRLHVHRSPERAGHRLVERDVQDAHGQEGPEARMTAGV